VKRIVVCCDGTWNRPDQLDRGQPRPSNVAKMALAVAPRDQAGVLQRVYYHRGVGTGRLDRVRGGAFGWGLSRNIKDAYLFLVESFEPGDELYFFGFSRGAYTVRSLAGLVRNCGLLRPVHVHRIAEGYALYRRRDRESNPRAVESQLFRKSYSIETPIKLIGVWDTVGALGIPSGPLGWLNGVLRLRFHDVKLSSYVENAFQALAIDERRRPFKPAIWERQEHARTQRLEQAWFPGVHTNVGGGYSDSGLSDIAFSWMKERAAECGLAFDETYVRDTIRPSSVGELRKSMTLFYRLLIPHQRRIPGMGEAPTHDVVHPSAYERQRALGYRPTNLPPAARR
jgi:uncharacterized protein (DUF2235 family)